MTLILEELTEQLEALEDLIEATNYKDEDMARGSIAAPGNDLTDGAERRTAILNAVAGDSTASEVDVEGAVRRGGVMITNSDLVMEDDVAELKISSGLDDNPNAGDYDENTLRAWDEELLESLDRLVVAFSSKDNLDEALEDDDIFGADTILSSYKVVEGAKESVLATKDVFEVVPSKVSAVFDYTEYTRFGLWTSTTTPSGEPDADTVIPPSVSYEDNDVNSETDEDLYAYSPLGITGLVREKLPSDVKGTYQGYTYATAAGTIYGGDLTIKIAWSDLKAATDETEIEVMISDLTDSDGGGWLDFALTDSERDSLAAEVRDDVAIEAIAKARKAAGIVKSITFATTKLVGFSAVEDMENTLDDAALAEGADVAGFSRLTKVPRQIMRLMSNSYMKITAQFMHLVPSKASFLVSVPQIRAVLASPGRLSVNGMLMGLVWKTRTP